MGKTSAKYCRASDDVDRAGPDRRVPEAWVHLKLEAIELQEAFDVVLGGDDVTNGKPDPDIYRLAAQCLGLPAQSCIAIEDSPVGIAAAVASGAYTVAVRTGKCCGRGYLLSPV